MTSMPPRHFELMQAKNHDYDEAWRSMRVTSYTDLILMKIHRTKQIESLSGQTLVSEGIDANYMDMINYSVFGLIKLEFENNRIHIAKHIWVNLCRFLLAGLFIFSGFVKAVDPLGTQYKIEDYLSAFGMTDWFPAFFPYYFPSSFPRFEFSVGVLLFSACAKGFYYAGISDDAGYDSPYPLPCSYKPCE